MQSLLFSLCHQWPQLFIKAVKYDSAGVCGSVHTSVFVFCPEVDPTDLWWRYLYSLELEYLLSDFFILCIFFFIILLCVTVFLPGT